MLRSVKRYVIESLYREPATGSVKTPLTGGSILILMSLLGLLLEIRVYVLLIIFFVGLSSLCISAGEFLFQSRRTLAIVFRIMSTGSLILGFIALVTMIWVDIRGL